MAGNNQILRFRRFLKELKRRKIFRVVIVYSGVAFIILQVTDLLVPALNLPAWTLSLVFVLLAVGFVIAVVAAWAFEVTPEGIVRITPTPSEAGEPREREQELPHGGKPFTGNAVIITLLVIIIGILLYPALISSDIPRAGETETGDRSGQSREYSPRLGTGSIAVLPFTYLAAEDSADYFSLGMTDELLSRLAQIEELAVIGRTSVMQYRDSDKTLPEIGRELGVAHLLEGSVQLAGNRVRIQAQLIESTGGTHLWADTYTYPFEDILDLQSRVARQVVRELEVELLPGDNRRTEQSRQVNPEAYRLYLQGRHLRFQERGPSLTRAARLLLRSVELDSTFAPAWATLASVGWLQPLFGGRLPRGWSGDSLSRFAARRALELDSTSAEAYIAMGVHYETIEFDFPAAGRWLKRATELNPGLANAHREFGLYLCRMGRFEPAERYLKEAVRIDPASPETWHALGWNEFFRGNHPAAKRHFEQALDLEPDYFLSQYFMAEIYLAEKDMEKALQEIRLAIQSNPSPVSYAGLARFYAVSGRPDSARAVFERHRDSISGTIGEAIATAALGQKDRAFDVLEEIGGHVHLKVGPEWEPLRGEPRYRQLLQRVGLDDASVRQTMERLREGEPSF